VRKTAFAVCLAFITGCAASKVFVAKEYTFAGKVAVLPMTNETNDLDAPGFLRTLLQNGLAGRGFQVLPLTEIDSQLKTQGFTDGGQLRATTPQKIGEWTGADSLLYSTIENFDYINVGFYSQRRVKVVSQLVSAKTGERLWEAERDASTRAVAMNKKDAEKLFAVQLAVKAVEKAAHAPLQAESHQVILKLLNALPQR
jgi:hypothetical protein